MSAVAVYMKTESGDSYLFCFPDLSYKEITDRLKSSMDTEIAYVFEVMVEGSSEDMGEYCKELKQAICSAAEEYMEDL